MDTSPPSPRPLSNPWMSLTNRLSAVFYSSIQGESCFVSRWLTVIHPRHSMLYFLWSDETSSSVCGCCLFQTVSDVMSCSLLSHVAYPYPSPSPAMLSQKQTQQQEQLSFGYKEMFKCQTLPNRGEQVWLAGLTL